MSSPSKIEDAIENEYRLKSEAFSKFGFYYMTKDQFIRAKLDDMRFGVFQENYSQDQ